MTRGILSELNIKHDRISHTDRIFIALLEANEDVKHFELPLQEASECSDNGCEKPINTFQ
jgi:hypothetical protein